MKVTRTRLKYGVNCALCGGIVSAGDDIFKIDALFYRTRYVHGNKRKCKKGG